MGVWKILKINKRGGGGGAFIWHLRVLTIHKIICYFNNRKLYGKPQLCSILFSFMYYIIFHFHRRQDNTKWMKNTKFLILMLLNVNCDKFRNSLEISNIVKKLSEGIWNLQKSSEMLTGKHLKFSFWWFVKTLTIFDIDQQSKETCSYHVKNCGQKAVNEFSKAGVQRNTPCGPAAGFLTSLISSAIPSLTW